jgi:hypothetical protein
LLSDARSGIATDPQELNRIDCLISPLSRQGQSIHHICANHADEIMLDEKSIYNYINRGILSVRNIDLPRKVRFHLRKEKKTVKIDKSCRKSRTISDFQAFMEHHQDTLVVQMDSVEGTRGGKVLLTIHFGQTQFMLAFLRDSNTAASVRKRRFVKSSATLRVKTTELMISKLILPFVIVLDICSGDHVASKACSISATNSGEHLPLGLDALRR